MSHDQEECTHPNFDWMNLDIISENPDPMDEVLACTQCGYIKWTARQVAQSQSLGNALAPLIDEQVVGVSKTAGNER